MLITARPTVGRPSEHFWIDIGRALAARQATLAPIQAREKLAMIDLLLSIAIWAIPVFTFLSLLCLIAGLRFTSLGQRINWTVVDLIWIGTSAVTLYLLVISTLYDRTKSEGQLAQNNYVAHLARGRDLANDNLETFCVGDNPRLLHITADERALFCRYNADAEQAFTAHLIDFQRNYRVNREDDVASIPEIIVTGPGGPDALVANVRWSRVRAEFVFQNDNVDELIRYSRGAVLPGFIHDLRVIWFYVFILFITMRLGKPIYERWFAPVQSIADSAAQSTNLIESAPDA